MGTKDIKIAGLNIGIALFNIILFSPGLVGIELNSSEPFRGAIGGAEYFEFIAFLIREPRS